MQHKVLPGRARPCAGGQTRTVGGDHCDRPNLITAHLYKLYTHPWLHLHSMTHPKTARKGLSDGLLDFGLCVYK